MPPVRSFGTTLSGLLICWAWTQGSASAAQPWALWQNPFRIPGGGTPTPTTPWDSQTGMAVGSPCHGGVTTVAKNVNRFTPQESAMGIYGLPHHRTYTSRACTEGNLSRREAETQRFQMSFLRTSAPLREIFSSPRGMQSRSVFFAHAAWDRPGRSPACHGDTPLAPGNVGALGAGVNHPSNGPQGLLRRIR